MKLLISQKVRAKLSDKEPPVSEEDIRQCFANRTGRFLTDTRAKNLSNPVTRWFIAETDFGRKLKICFVPLGDAIAIRTAYDPNAIELGIYTEHGE